MTKRENSPDVDRGCNMHVHQNSLLTPNKYVYHEATVCVLSCNIQLIFFETFFFSCKLVMIGVTKHLVWRNKPARNIQITNYYYYIYPGGAPSCCFDFGLGLGKITYAIFFTLLFHACVCHNG